MKPIYLDYNATTPIDPRVAEAMSPYLFEHFGNPSSGHIYGITTKKAVEKARRQIADLIHCSPDEIIFTSGGSESNNYAIKGAAFSYRKKGNHIITSSVEHPAVSEVCRFLEANGFSVTYLPVDEFGLVNIADFEKAITPQTVLVTIMHANNEVGTIEPIAEIAHIAHKHDIIVHSDCAQSIGKIPVNADELGVDMLSIAGHKLYAPKGIGALYVKDGINLEKQVHGADHERNLRAGTENVLEIVGLGEACESINSETEKHHEYIKSLRDRLEKGLKAGFPEMKINGHPEKRLPNTCSVSFPGIEANIILSELTSIAASAGAACHSDTVEVSSVLEAMRVPLEYAMGTIRLSVGRFTKAEEIDKAIEDIISVVQRIKPGQVLGSGIEKTGEVKLTQYTHGLGCACKLRPQLLEEVLKNIPAVQNDDVLVGTESSDDAAVYRINESTAVVQTVDFFTPIVDDPFQFGVIAAVNSLSDIYAMGGKPLFALNIVGFPSNRLPMSVLKQILQGALSVAKEAGIAIIGGHTIDDTEPKYGLAVTGTVHPDKVVTNKNAKTGDKLILTKPLGTGVMSTALKHNALDDKQKTLLVETMSALNKTAAECMIEVGVNSATDITGFGLLGHLLEMMNGSGMSAEIDSKSVPVMPGVEQLISEGFVPGGTNDNFAFTESSVDYGNSVSRTQRLIFNDAQTSGGLLISISEDKADKLLALLTEKGVDSSFIGRVIENVDSVISVK